MPDTATPTLTARLADLIRDSGRTQRDIAAAASISQQYLSDLLGGKRDRISAEYLTPLARALGLSPTALGRLLYDSYPQENIPEKIR